MVLVAEHHVAEALLDLLQLEVERIKQPGVDLKGIVKVLHAVAGALKNLSLAGGCFALGGSYCALFLLA